MEKFIERVDPSGDITKETKAELNDIQENLIKESGPEIQAIKDAIASLKSFKDLPLIINYPLSSNDKIKQQKFPKTLDMWPKPFGDKRKNIEGNIVSSPDPLIICLDNRKFTVTPDIGSISKIDISQGNINLDISKFGVKIKSQVYDPERMTKLLIILWTHGSGLNTDIANTPWAEVQEIK